MDVTAVVAVVGAVTGTASLLIQGAAWRASGTRIDLDVNPGTASVPGYDDGGGGSIGVKADVVFIQITNRSPHSVKITHTGAIDADDDQRGFFFPQPLPFNRLPFEIPARDNVTVWVLREGLDAERLRFLIKTAAGEKFQTKPLVLGDLPQLETTSFGPDG